jgi:hypothetical protein
MAEKKGCKHRKHERKESKTQEVVEHLLGKEKKENYGKKRKKK